MISRIERFEENVVKSTVENIIVDYEILDGCPSKGTIIPFRIFTQNYPLWPSSEDYLNCLSLFIKYKIYFAIFDQSNQKYIFEVGNNTEIFKI